MAPTFARRGALAGTRGGRALAPSSLLPPVTGTGLSSRPASTFLTQVLGFTLNPEP
jgi:hypothetical protein